MHEDVVLLCVLLVCRVNSFLLVLLVQRHVGPISALVFLVNTVVTLGVVVLSVPVTLVRVFVVHLLVVVPTPPV